MAGAPLLCFTTMAAATSSSVSRASCSTQCADYHAERALLAAVREMLRKQRQVDHVNGTITVEIVSGVVTAIEAAGVFGRLTGSQNPDANEYGDQRNK